MPEHKKQHYLPEFYLKGFSRIEKFGTGESNVLWRYSKEDRDIKKKSIENTGHFSYLYSFKQDSGEYDHALEEKLSQIEGEARLVIARIEAGINRVLLKQSLQRHIFPQDKCVIITFLFLMMSWPAFSVVSVIRRMPCIINNFVNSRSKFIV